MKGSCLCGKVAFEVDVEHLKIYQCHCEQCRKQSGTASSCGAVSQSSKFSWISGQDNITKWTRPSGFTSHFCRSCGSPVPNQLRELPYYWMPAGLINSENIEIVANLYLCEAVNWGSVSKEKLPFDTVPSLDSLIQILDA